MIFNKPSLRTRISFDMAMRHLGVMRYLFLLLKLVWDSANPSRMSPE